jgi:hypothetical protein
MAWPIKRGEPQWVAARSQQALGSKSKTGFGAVARLRR